MWNNLEKIDVSKTYLERACYFLFCEARMSDRNEIEEWFLLECECNTIYIKSCHGVLRPSRFNNEYRVDVGLDNISNFEGLRFFFPHEDARSKIVIKDLNNELAHFMLIFLLSDFHDLSGDNHTFTEGLRTFFDHFKEQILIADRIELISLVVEWIDEFVLDKVQHWAHVSLSLLFAELGSIIF